MPSLTCVCGARYRFPEASVGKRAKCKKCGTVLALEDDSAPIAIAPEIHVPTEESSPTNRQHLGPIPEPVIETASRSESDSLDQAPRAVRGYWASALWALLFPSTPHNLVTFLMIAVFFGLVKILIPMIAFFYVFGLIFAGVLYGWYFAYLFDTVANAAGGDEDLPSFTGADSWTDYLFSAIKWVGSWAVVFAPAFVFIITLLSSSGTQSTQNYDYVKKTVDLLSANPSQWAQADGVQFIFLILVGAGVFCWPMVILCVALGGFSSLARPDLIIRTLIRTWDGYLLTLAALAATISLQRLVHAALTSSGMGTVVSMVLYYAIVIYMDIVTMKLIGLYYHHFKHKFAWSWG